MNKQIPTRDQLSPEDKWDLSSLFTSTEAWDQALEQMKEMIPKISAYEGSLDSSPETLASCLRLFNEIGILHERLEYYAFLNYAGDANSSENQARMGTITQVSSEAAAGFSFFEPELLAVDEHRMKQLITSPEVQPFAVKLGKLLRYRPHTLSQKEERILALQRETQDTPSNAFEALTNVDIDYGTVVTDEGELPLSQSTLASFLTHPDGAVRKQAYDTFYSRFEQHQHTLAALFTGSVKQDVYQARVRNFPSARAMALFPDQVNEEVYDGLVTTVREGLPLLHRCYELKRRRNNLPELRHCDLYLPFVQEVKTHYPFDQAVDEVCRAVSPLGTEYTSILREGLTGGWVDKYENRGKRSGAFSAGSYTGYPYILMNYKEDVLRDLFTLAHEGGHSMHSYYSGRNNPFQHYSYTIFEAEVASTFNEQLLGASLLEQNDDPAMEAYIIGKQLDDITATIFRQTMFAEFEQVIHAAYEGGTPLTTDLLRSSYRDLMTDYLGESVALEPVSDLEGLRIPHFYRAFYVYKYATGLSAALALSRQVLQGDRDERDQYLQFLSSGGSTYPIDSLKRAGVDMSSPEPVRAALQTFSDLLDRMELLLGSL